MRILLPLLWELNVIITLQLASAVYVNRRLRRLQLKLLPRDLETNCQVIDSGSTHIIMGQTCTSMPRNYTLIGTSLHIKYTGITSLQEGAFDNYSRLTSLTIEMNYNLNNISTGTFDKLDNLINLTISYNLQLQYLDSDMFRGLNNLKRLWLIKNSYMDFYYISLVVRPAILPSLISLDVSENTLRIINSENTHQLAGSKLQYLRLTLCSLSSIEPTAFNNLPNLKGLFLDKNNLKTQNILDLIEHITTFSPSFAFLDVGTNYIEDPNVILSSIANTRISHVDLRDNHFSTFIAPTIPSMPSIVYLDFSETGAASLTKDSFTSDKLPNIEYLYLSNNRMFSERFSLSLPTLRVLDLSDNSNPHGYNPIFSIGDFGLKNMLSLEYLRLDSNTIGKVIPNYFNGLINLKELHLYNTSIRTIEPDSFSSLKSLEMLDLSYNSLFQERAINNRTFTGLNNLKILNLNRCEITCLEDDYTFIHTPQLRVLSLQKNSLLELHTMLLMPVTKLEFLDLSFNAFQPWDQRLFTKNYVLNNVDLSYSKITSFTPAMLEDLKGLQHINLLGNLFSCYCKDLEILSPYVNSPTGNGQQALIRALNDSQPICSSPKSTMMTSFLNRVRSHQGATCIDEESTIIVILVMVAMGGIIAFAVPVIYCLRWHIKYWLFLLRQAMSCYIFPSSKYPKSEGRYTYDAFVSYSNEDRGFVVRLVSMLESHSPHFRLCVFERDFNVGGMITDSIVESLAKSRRTILILSDSFAKSTWCQWEMSMAHHKRLFFKDDQDESLIIIKIGEILDKHMTPTLRYLIRTRIYLQWNSDPIKQKVFWKKLRTALVAPVNDNDTKLNFHHTVSTQGETVNNNITTGEPFNYLNEPFHV